MSAYSANEDIGKQPSSDTFTLVNVEKSETELNNLKNKVSILEKEQLNLSKSVLKLENIDDRNLVIADPTKQPESV